MNIKLFKPESSLLKEYIEFFYVLTRTKDEKDEMYLTFPNRFVYVAINPQSESVIEKHKISIRFNKNRRFSSKLNAKYVKPLCIEYTGEINEINIAFKPLGINAFLENDLEFYNEESVTNLNFIPYHDFEETMLDMLSKPEDEEKIKALETYLISKYKGFKHPFLKSVINEIMNQDSENMSLQEIAEKHNISHKTLIAQFKKHVCKTPSDFRKIIRFRNAMSRKNTDNSTDNLTDITYALNYFDQSHMVKDFKALTGFTPKEFFKNLTSMEKSHINWIFPHTS
jgi:YesN/AraC family two-component response regulator